MSLRTNPGKSFELSEVAKKTDIDPNKNTKSSQISLLALGFMTAIAACGARDGLPVPNGQVDSSSTSTNAVTVGNGGSTAVTAGEGGTGGIGVGGAGGIGGTGETVGEGGSGGFGGAGGELPVGPWSKHFEAINSLENRTLAVDQIDNSIYLGGFLGTSTDFGGGELPNNTGMDTFVAKFDTFGNYQWAKTFQWANQRISALSVDKNHNLIVTGDFYQTINLGGEDFQSNGGGDIFVGKFDSNGHHLWSNHFGTAGDQGSKAMDVDSQGNIIVTGYYENNLNFDANPNSAPLPFNGWFDTFVAKFDPNGHHIWSRGFGDAEAQMPIDMAIDAANNPIITTYVYGSQGNWVLLDKFDPNGNKVWGKTLTDNQDNTIYPGSVAVDTSNNVFITLSDEIFDDPNSLVYTTGILKKYDKDGNEIWTKNFTGNSQATFLLAPKVQSGNIVLGGTFIPQAFPNPPANTNFGIDFEDGVKINIPTPWTSYQIFTAFIKDNENNGTSMNAEHFGDGGDQRMSDMTLDSQGNKIISGIFNGTVDFGDSPYSPHTVQDYSTFLAKLKSPSP